MDSHSALQVPWPVGKRGSIQTAILFPPHQRIFNGLYCAVIPKARIPGLNFQKFSKIPKKFWDITALHSKTFLTHLPSSNHPVSCFLPIITLWTQSASGLSVPSTLANSSHLDKSHSYLSLFFLIAHNLPTGKPSFLCLQHPTLSCVPPLY